MKQDDNIQRVKCVCNGIENNASTLRFHFMTHKKSGPSFHWATLINRKNNYCQKMKRKGKKAVNSGLHLVHLLCQVSFIYISPNPKFPFNPLSHLILIFLMSLLPLLSYIRRAKSLCFCPDLSACQHISKTRWLGTLIVRGLTALSMRCNVPGLSRAGDLCCLSFPIGLPLDFLSAL